jgi:hypothetical protein
MQSSADDPEPGLHEILTRGEAIARLRATLLDICGDRSMCRAAAEEGIFCRGFRRWPDHEFHDRWRGHLGVSTHLTRPQMEELADLWQLTEQIRRRSTLICDAQTLAPGACRGWDEFSDADLEGFCREILGARVSIRYGNGSNESNGSRVDKGLLTSPPMGDLG